MVSKLVHYLQLQLDNELLDLLDIFNEDLYIDISHFYHNCVQSDSKFVMHIYKVIVYYTLHEFVFRHTISFFVILFFYDLSLLFMIGCNMLTNSDTWTTSCITFLYTFVFSHLELNDDLCLVGSAMNLTKKQTCIQISL